jgi:hypothetical protein
MAIILKPGEYQWRETAGGTGWSLLRNDPKGDTQARLLRYAPMTMVPAARLDHTVQWLVTRGEARCGELELRRGGYFCWPAGAQRLAIQPGPEGYTVLSLVTRAGSSVARQERAVPDPETLPWEPADADGLAALGTLGRGGLEIRRLDRDPESGARADLWQLQPDQVLQLGTATVAQEFYVLRGSLRWEGERVPGASYLAFSPGDDRGALEAQERPAVLFVNLHSP